MYDNIQKHNSILVDYQENIFTRLQTKYTQGVLALFTGVFFLRTSNKLVNQVKLYLKLS